MKIVFAVCFFTIWAAFLLLVAEGQKRAPTPVAPDIDMITQALMRIEAKVERLEKVVGDHDEAMEEAIRKSCGPK